MTGQNRPTDALPPAPEPPWHTLDSGEVLRMLDTQSVRGLSGAEARRRLGVSGPNQLPGQPPRSLWLRFIDQFRSQLILVLIGAAGLAAMIGDVTDALVILGVVVINAELSFLQEYRAEQSLAALKKMLAPEAEVRRDGQSQKLPAPDLVPGDIVLLASGARVPADGRLLRVYGLEVDESSLTGESHTVGKRVLQDRRLESVRLVSGRDGGHERLLLEEERKLLRRCGAGAGSRKRREHMIWRITVRTPEYA